VNKQKNTAARNIPGRKSRKIIPDLKNRNKDGAVRMVGFFLPLKQNAAKAGDSSSLPVNKQKNTAARNVPGRKSRKINLDRKSRKKDGAVKTVEFSLPPQQNAAKAGDSSSLPVKKRKNTAAKYVPTRKNLPGPKNRKSILDRKNPKKDGAVRTVKFFLLIC
jgi:copper chaperone CopZ